MRIIFALLISIGVQAVARQFVSVTTAVGIGCFVVFVFLFMTADFGGRK